MNKHHPHIFSSQMKKKGPFMKAPIPKDERERLHALSLFDILDTTREERFDRITKEATEKLKAPISTISIVDKNREWFKSCVGLDEKEGPREVSFCGHALLAKDVFIVEDTLKDERFKHNPYVIGKPYLRFYAGMALFDHKSGFPLGVFCIKDTRPRKFSNEELFVFMNLAERAETELNTKIKSEK
ncbi:MAG: GAF domain-containing protein [Candidatus Pacebacteria bacterium]|nr:GAF domain-containing protein [Candidatus Paceibacterota bacterium]